MSSSAVLDSTRPRGVYFLANDRVSELTIAFLNSFRRHNRDTPLCLIPYDDRHHEIASLRSTYSFEILRNERVLGLCDEISIGFHGKTAGAYRKLAAWDGVFDEFIYIDVDTVVLDDVTFAFKGLDYCDVLTSHSNLPSLVKWVWKDSIHESGLLTDDQIAFSANTGFIVSTKAFMSFDRVLEGAARGLALKDHMELYCQEQPLLNYLMVTSGKIYGSLLALFQSGIDHDFKFELWAGIEGGIVENGGICFPDDDPSSALPRFLVHWAGLWKAEGHSLRNDIPYKDLWQYYRHLDPAAWQGQRRGQ